MVLGGGGHAKVVIDALRSANAATIVAILDADPSLVGKTVLGVSVVGGDEKFPELMEEGFRCFAIGVGALETSELRQRLFSMCMNRGLEPMTVVHPAATVSNSAELAPGCQIFAGSIVNPDAIVGANAIINTGALIEHDCEIGDHAHVAPGARLGGGVRVDGGAVIGIGATVHPSIAIGENAVVGAGAVVIRDVPPNVVVAGVPADAI